jgi:hypothetical protein
VSDKVTLMWENPADAPPAAYQTNSTDGGVTWDFVAPLDPPVAYGGDTVTAYSWNSLFPWYDRQDRFHLVVNFMPWWDTMAANTGAYFPSQLWHYCPDNDPAWSHIASAYVDTSHWISVPGGNANLACRPSIGQDDDGNLFVTWEQFDTLNVEELTSRLRADIWAARSTDNGASWGPGLKLTDAGTYSMRFPSVIDLAVEGDPDTVFVIYEADSMAGFFVQGEGIMTRNPVLVQRLPVTDLPVGVAEQKPDTPTQLAVSAGPNPFRRSTRLSYAVPYRGNVSLDIFDAAGRNVRTLAKGRSEAGRFDATWNGRSQSGALVPEGVYLYRYALDGKRVTGKLTLTR